MSLPQISLRTLLTITGGVAIWFATFPAGNLGADVRKILQLVILVVASASVLYYRQRRQAFWIGFVFVFLLVACSQLNELAQPIVPRIRWAQATAEYFKPVPTAEGKLFRHYYSIYDTVWLCSALAMSFLGGYLSLLVYDRAIVHAARQSK
jgi:hypothetical protein